MIRASLPSSRPASAAVVHGHGSSHLHTLRQAAVPGLASRCHTRCNATVGGPCGPAPAGRPAKEALVQEYLDAKRASGLTFTEIAAKTGLTNFYVAQLFHGQAQLHPDYVEKLQAVVPGLKSDHVARMKLAPSRRFDPELIQEPAVYRLYEAIMHGGESIKAIINEQCGDGIMSAIDFYANIETMDGLHGEKRVVITLNGKFLPYVVQATKDDVTQRSA